MARSLKRYVGAPIPLFEIHYQEMVSDGIKRKGLVVDYMFRWILCGAYSMGIFLVSLMPSKTLKGILTHIGIPHKDKVLHFAMYGVLAVLVMWALRVRRIRGSLVFEVISGCFLYGALIEVLQHTVAAGDRHFSWADMIANGLGAGIAVICYMRFKKQEK